MHITQFRWKFRGERRFSAEGWNTLVRFCAPRSKDRPRSSESRGALGRAPHLSGLLPGRFPGAIAYESARGSAHRRRFRTAMFAVAPPVQRDWCFRGC